MSDTASFGMSIYYERRSSTFLFYGNIRPFRTFKRHSYFDELSQREDQILTLFRFHYICGRDYFSPARIFLSES